MPVCTRCAVSIEYTQVLRPKWTKVPCLLGKFKGADAREDMWEPLVVLQTVLWRVVSPPERKLGVNKPLLDLDIPGTEIKKYS